MVTGANRDRFSVAWLGVAAHYAVLTMVMSNPAVRPSTARADHSAALLGFVSYVTVVVSAAGHATEGWL
jgi:hypothetical protein